MLPKLAAALLLVAIGCAGVTYIQGGQNPQRVEMPPWNLSDLPMQLGQWTGEDIKQDPRTFQVLGAEQSIDRAYRDQSGHQVSVHCAVFLDYNSSVHFPIVCYRGAGYEIVQEESVLLSEDGERGPRVGLMTVERDNTRSWVLYWYEMGDRIIDSYDSAKTARRAHFLKNPWPPLVKVMLQTSAGDPGAARRQMIEIGQEIYRWMNPKAVL